MRYSFLFSFLALSAVCLAQNTIGGGTPRHKVNEIVPEDAAVEILADGFNWSEGPVWVSELQAVLFTDVPENKLYRWDEKMGCSFIWNLAAILAMRQTKRNQGEMD